MNEEKAISRTATDAAAALGRLEAELQGNGRKSLPPVELWDPPYCGDIGMAIARDGTWTYKGSAIRRIALVKLFSTVLRRDDDGCHYLVTPVEKIDVTVEDAPFLGVEMEVIDGGRPPAEQVLVVRTNLDDVVRIDGAHALRFACDSAGGFKPYVRVRGRLEALFTRALTYELVDRLATDADGRSGIWSSGCFFGVEGI